MSCSKEKLKLRPGNRSQLASGRWQRRRYCSAHLSKIEWSGLRHLPGVLWILVCSDRLPDFQIDLPPPNSWGWYWRIDGVGWMTYLAPPLAHHLFPVIVGPVTLLNGQRLIGQDATASLSSITGLTPPTGSDPLPAMNSGNGTIVNITTGNAITVASGNTLRGFTGGNSTTDITGAAFGTLTISDVTLNGTGQALNLINGTLAANLGGISSTNSATTGMTLTGVAGTLTTPTTTVTNPTGIGISVVTSSAALNFGNTSSTSSGGTGVSLLTNTGAITFGSLAITPDATRRGLLATDNTNTITSTSGAISTTGAVASMAEAVRGDPMRIILTS